MSENLPPSDKSNKGSLPLEREALPVSVSFAELAFAHFLMSREQREQGVLHGPAESEFERLRRSFEASEGAIVKAWWGVNIALGMALTLKAPRRINRILGNLDAEATCTLHRATEGLALPAEVEAALFDGDLLAVKASGVLHGRAGRLALERVMGAQTYILSLIDASKGDIPRPVEPEPEPLTPPARILQRSMRLQ